MFEELSEEAAEDKLPFLPMSPSRTDCAMQKGLVDVFELQLQQ